ncbi:DUF7093 family protein [Salinigranum sp. GCM10025319]|uniref:DUF7093 family protein n=1 Tax=Salinigranum sp. GCM10025319 TaxID=3252687 RepID=UPI0036224A2B
MGLRCLLGHDFGPSGVVREHEEDGSEMVVTEREVRRCRRCGEEQVLSESTEVRAIRTEADVGVDRRDADAVAPASSTQGAQGSIDADEGNPFGGTGGPNETADPAGLDGAGDANTPGQTTSPPAPETDDETESQESNTSLIERAEAGFDDATDAAEEDAVILDDGEKREPRGHGEWPDSDAEMPAGDAEPGPERSIPGESEATAAPSGPTERTAAVDGGEDESTPLDTPGTATDATDATIPTDAEGGDDAASDAEEQSIAETAAEEDAELIGGGPDDASESDAAANGRDVTNGLDATANGSESGSGAGSAWPDHDGEDEGFAAEGATSGGPGIAYGNEITPESTNGQGRSQGHDAGNGYETSYIDNTVEERDGDGTIVSARSDEAAEPRPGVETEYYCPNCGHARPLDSSLRSGDICPECQSGYIAEREQ